MVEIIPAVIPKSLEEIREKISLVGDSAHKIQIDILDGKYAPTITWPFENLEALRDKLPGASSVLEMDLMIIEPENFLKDFISMGAKSFVIHIDSTPNLRECINIVREHKLSVGLGVRPSVGLDLTVELMGEIDFIQFMGSDNIGFHDVPLSPLVYDKVREFRRDNPNIPIQVDIGVTFDTASKLISAGATGLVSGSDVFEGGNIEQNIKKLQSHGGLVG